MKIFNAWQFIISLRPKWENYPKVYKKEVREYQKVKRYRVILYTSYKKGRDIMKGIRILHGLS